MNNVISFTLNDSILLIDYLKALHISKRNIYLLEQQKAISLNGQIIPNTFLLSKNDIIRIDISFFEEINTLPVKGTLQIVFEDDDFIVLNKPCGILIHPDGNTTETLANYLSYYFNQKNLIRTIRPIQRLDFDTSGLIVFPKHFISASYLSYLIENNQFYRSYLAIVEGKINKDGIINQPIGKDRHNNNKYIIYRLGKTALTTYKLIACSPKYSLIEARIFSGRTHQIRVHMKSINHPVVGDKIYGTTNKRLFLHAHKVSFINFRTNASVNFETEIPTEFIDLIKKPQF